MDTETLNPLVLSHVLTELRLSRGLSQRELARRSGVHEKTISSFESGARVQSAKLRQIVAIAVACDATLISFAHRVAAMEDEDAARQRKHPLERFREAMRA